MSLEVRDVTKRFGGTVAVRKCSLKVKDGLITGLIGPNGAGKTTLFNVITGYYRPDEGEIWFKGKRIEGLPTWKIALEGLSRTYQIPREFRRLTVLENLLIAAKSQKGENLFNSFLRPGLVKSQEEKNKEKAFEILEFLELKDLANEYASNLSAGQKKLLEMARVLMTEPRVILLDEPTSGVNPVLAEEIITRIRDLRDFGKTFFIIEHSMKVMEKLADYVYFMSDGEMICEGGLDEVREDEKMINAYLGL